MKMTKWNIYCDVMKVISRRNEWLYKWQEKKPQRKNWLSLMLTIHTFTNHNVINHFPPKNPQSETDRRFNKKPMKRAFNCNKNAVSFVCLEEKKKPKGLYKVVKEKKHLIEWKKVEVATKIYSCLMSYLKFGFTFRCCCCYSQFTMRLRFAIEWNLYIQSIVSSILFQHLAGYSLWLSFQYKMQTNRLVQSNKDISV